MRIRLLFFIIGGIAGAVTGLGAGYWRWHEPFDPYARQRWAIVNAADDAATGGALLIGDSIVQRLVMTDLCGLPVFNAGMAGARSDQIAPLAKPLVEKLKPRIIVLSAGTNDRQQGRMPDLGLILPPPPPA
ncbi:MAG: hypothetical protein JNL35_05160 [Sphingopyxis sp.]|nr:hypothetical protein [Sphingopyxis sp.]